MRRRFLATEFGPWKLQLVVLGIVFVTELCLMLVLLPALRMENSEPWLAALLDATILTLVLVPLFGWLVVRPLRHMLQVRSRLLEQFIAVQEEERARIARDLHDEIGQSFTTVLIGLRAMNEPSVAVNIRERASELAKVVAETIEEVRRLARGLRPAVLDHLGLVQAIEQYAEDFQRAHKTVVAVSAKHFDAARRLPAVIETAVYRIVQESLTNTARHAQASRIQITLLFAPDSLKVELVDDGRGFAPRDADPLASAGILGMTERAVLVRGTVDVTSEPGGGTRVALWIPLPEEKAR